MPRALDGPREPSNRMKHHASLAIREWEDCLRSPSCMEMERSAGLRDRRAQQAFGQGEERGALARSSARAHRKVAGRHKKIFYGAAEAEKQQNMPGSVCGKEAGVLRQKAGHFSAHLLAGSLGAARPVIGEMQPRRSRALSDRSADMRLAILPQDGRRCSERARSRRRYREKEARCELFGCRAKGSSLPLRCHSAPSLLQSQLCHLKTQSQPAQSLSAGPVAKDLHVLGNPASKEALRRKTWEGVASTPRARRRCGERARKSRAGAHEAGDKLPLLAQRQAAGPSRWHASVRAAGPEGRETALASIVWESGMAASSCHGMPRESLMKCWVRRARSAWG